MEFCKKLKKLRTENGISQQKLADTIFVSRSAVAKWENGLGFPSEDSYAALSKFFGVSEKFLKTDDPEATVIEKNKKIKHLSCSTFSAAAVIIAIFVLFALFHPVPYYASASCDAVSVSVISENAKTREITEDAKVEQFIDLLNSVNFQKSLRLSREAPDSLRAIFTISSNGITFDDILLCSTSNNEYFIYVSIGENELVSYRADTLCDYMLLMIQC